MVSISWSFALGDRQVEAGFFYLDVVGLLTCNVVVVQKERDRLGKKQGVSDGPRLIRILGDGSYPLRSCKGHLSPT